LASTGVTAVVVLRDGVAGDGEAIAVVFAEAAGAAWGHIVGPGRLAGLEPEVGRWEGRLGALRKGWRVVVAVADGQVVGFAFLGPAMDADAGDRDGELHAFYTHPRVWGRGVGRALLAETLATLREAGHDAVLIWTEERNHRPRRVYEQAGAVPDGVTRERTWMGAPLRELRYRLPLA
jgi:GNAT superfamily N-acetyltransferase